MFDVDELRASMEAPSIKIDGKLHVGRILSHHEMLPFMADMKKMQAHTLQGSAQRVFILSYLNTVFPVPLWRRFAFWTTPMWKISKLPDPLLLRALTDFFVCQGNAYKQMLEGLGVDVDELQRDSDLPASSDSTASAATTPQASGPRLTE